MEANSSSSNDSLLPPEVFTGVDCFFVKPGNFIFISYCITCILLFLPVCIFIIYLGVQRWHQQRSTSAAAAAATSHSDVFTYHTVALKLIEVFGYLINCCGIHGNNVNIFILGYGLWLFTWCVATFFHILTCVERYLAVVHPVTYLSLRGEKGTRIRNISIGCVWLVSFGSLFDLSDKTSTLLIYCMSVFSCIIISFCSLSVLRVLIRPGPGEQGGARGRVDQSKRRAFYTILSILGVLLIRLIASLVILSLGMSGESIGCVLDVTEIWFNIPSTLVLPLLCLHRAGRFMCCKNNAK